MRSFKYHIIGFLIGVLGIGGCGLEPNGSPTSPEATKIEFQRLAVPTDKLTPNTANIIYRMFLKSVGKSDSVMALVWEVHKLDVAFSEWELNAFKDKNFSLLAYGKNPVAVDPSVLGFDSYSYYDVVINVELLSFLTGSDKNFILPADEPIYFELRAKPQFITARADYRISLEQVLLAGPDRATKVVAEKKKPF